MESARFAPSDDRSLDQVTSSRRLLEAARQWIDAIGPLAAHCLPIEGAGRPIGIGVRTNGGRLVRAWRLRAGDVDEVEVLPDDAHPFAYIDGWAGMWMGSPPAGPNWPWILLRDDIAAQSIAVLESELPLGGDSGVWHDELRYRQCRILAQEATIFHRPLGVHDLLARAEEALAAARPAVRTLFRFGRFDLADVQLQELAEWLRGLPQDCVERPVPAPDLDGRSGSGWVWDVYSDQRLLEYAAEVYGNACQAYDELARHTFGKFAWSLGLSAIAPVAIVGSVHPASEGVYPSPGIDYRQIPLDLMQAEVAGRSGVWISRNGRCALSLAERSEGYSPDRWDDHWRVVSTWIAAQRGATPFRRAVVGSSVLHTNQDRPASAIAAGWMFDDLKAFGLAQGTFPRLDH